MRVIRKKFKYLAVFLVVLLLIPSGTQLNAASHREAPLISEDPTADNTDTYAFVSPEDPSKVVFIANYIPVEAPAGGPNFYNFSDQVAYDIHIVNNFSDGDARDDVTFRFQFQTAIKNPATFLYNTSTITSNADQNIQQTYTLTGIRGDPNDPSSPSFVIASGLTVAPNYVGVDSVPNPDVPAVQSIYAPGGIIRVFAGQRDEGFFADLGAIFDLLQVRTVTGTNGGQGVDALAGFNVHTIALEVPINLLTQDGSVPTDPNDPRAVIGVYASASRRGANGAFQQVSRLANPLVNEVIIPLGLKDIWNQRDPNGDATFLPFFQNPELPGLLNALFGVIIPITSREDLVQVFLTGVPGLNFTGNTPIADLLRLNVAIPPKKPTDTGFSRLGVIGGDTAGFPNGRRPQDDVVDIALRAMAGVLVPGFNVAPNNILGDGVDGNDRPFPGTFPFLPAPNAGSAQAGIKKVGEISYLAVMNGANEVPPVTTSATGKATLTQQGSTVNFRIDLSNITNVIAAHIHSGLPGVNGPIRVFLFNGPTTGLVNGTLAQGAFTAADVSGITFDQLINELRTGAAYVNVHTTANPNGEIRGQVQLQ